MHIKTKKQSAKTKSEIIIIVRISSKNNIFF
jgi:hypothetical protein